MQKHIKIYFDYFHIGEQDIVTCELCKRQGRADEGGFDMHHIFGRGKGKDIISNVMLLCRACHTEAHRNLKKSYLQDIHNRYLDSF